MENNIMDTITAMAASFGVMVAIWATYLTNKSINENNKNHAKQVFENKIFKLINIHNVMLSRFSVAKTIYNSGAKSIYNDERIYYGHAAISFWLDGFKMWLDAFKDGLMNLPENQTEANVYRYYCNTYFDFKDKRYSFCFIGNVIAILSLIKNNEEKLTKEKENFYLELLHAQISKEELVVIFYYIHTYKEDKKPLFEKYAFFENIDEQLLFNWQEEINLYKKEAYGAPVLAS